jgi:ribosomal protein L37AE/L43A
MGERVLRGSRLGTTSYEADRNTDLAPRREVVYDCPAGHETRMVMASDAEVPGTWECRSCGVSATLRDGEAGEPRPTKTVRSHWDMLLERRSISDLEDVLNERLAVLHPEPRTRKSA